MSHHTDREYAAELRALRERLIDMAETVCKMVETSMRAFARRDADLASEAMHLDREVNEADKDITAKCILILAKRQPMGSDLRFITQAFKMVSDLERIGDLTVNVCERVVQLDGHAFGDDRLAKDIIRMGGKVKEMVEDAMDGFLQRDDEIARDVIDDDEEIDDLYVSVFRRALEEMRAEHEKVEPGIHIMSIAKVLERMADHATNLAEQVVFMVEGEDIRHTGKRIVPA
jgi:phosphate transport system protein